jgi:DNA primase
MEIFSPNILSLPKHPNYLLADNLPQIMEVPSLHPDTINEVKAKADIYEVVSSYVVLKKQGRDFQGLCPFHQERSPSFTVSPSKQMYYCFGCQAGGNAIKFLMEVNKRSFAEVVLDLANQYPVTVRTLAPEKRQELQRQLTEREQLTEIVAMAANFYQHTLQQPTGAEAKAYLQRRQLSPATIQQFQLGYAPNSWDTLFQYLTVSKKFPAKLVELAGLIIPRKEGSGYFDRFRHRLMLPIWDSRGQIIGFGGRSLGEDQPKYLNSPETPLFDKGKNLYGLNRAATAIKQTDRAVVVEGYFDVIALHAAGITEAVASLGTALSDYQIKQLLRLTQSKQIILNFDADRAGKLATERAIAEVADLAYRGQVQLKVLNLPAGKDADEFLTENSSQDYQDLLAQAPLWIDWQLERAIQGVDLQDARGYQQAVATSVQLLALITDPTTRTYYLQKTAQLLCNNDVRQIPLLVENLNTSLKRQERQVKKTSTPEPSTTSSPEINLLPLPQQRLVEHAEIELLRLYLHYPEYRLAIIEAMEESDVIFSLSHHRFIWQKIVDACQQGVIDYLDPQLIAYLQDLHGTHSTEMGRVGHLFHLNEKTSQEILRSPLVIRAATACLAQVFLEKQRSDYLALWNNPGTAPERKQECYQLFYEAQKKLDLIKQQRLFSIADLSLGIDQIAIEES